MKKVTFLIILTLTIFQISCSKDENSQLKYENLKSLRIGDYEMQVPEYFVLEEGTGIDSYIGTISAKGIEIRFDYGPYNVPPNITNPENYEVIFENSDPIEKYIVIPKDLRERVGLHIRNLNIMESGNFVSLNMVAEDLTKEQQNLVVNIFESVHFVD